MTEIQALAQRVAQLEIELAGLRREVAEGKKPIPPKNWLDSLTGSFADYPQWDEVLRLGKEWRDSQKEDDDEDKP